MAPEDPNAASYGDERRERRLMIAMFTGIILLGVIGILLLAAKRLHWLW